MVCFRFFFFCFSSSAKNEKTWMKNILRTVKIWQSKEPVVVFKYELYFFSDFSEKF